MKKYINLFLAVAEVIIALVLAYQIDIEAKKGMAISAVLFAFFGGINISDAVADLRVERLKSNESELE